MHDTSQTDSPPPIGSTADPRRWRALAVISVIQFILVLDMTVVNIALPSIQNDLEMSPTGLAWVVNGYILMAGSLLLLGGRLGDIFGRQKTLAAGVALFGVASAICGSAVNPGMLISGRLLQGVGEALAAPASLGLIAVMFTDSKERAKALGIWGGVAGLGGVLGTVVSGLLTDLANWRWIFYINIPIVIIALVLIPRTISESRMARTHRRIDLPGAILGTGGLICIVYGLLQASEHDWGSSQVLLPLIGGAALLALMVGVEARTAEPLIPLSFFTNRTRVTTNFITLLQSSGFFSYVFLLTLFEQQVLGYSPLKGGLGYLPLGLALGVGVGLASGLMPKVGVKPLLAAGLFGTAIGLLLTTWMVDVDSSYAGGVLPGMLLVGLFSGLCFPTMANSALHEVTTENAGLASGVQTSMQQIGGAVGLAFLVTFALRATAEHIADGVDPGAAAADGYWLALRIGAAMLIVGSVLVLLLFEKVSARPRNQLGEYLPEKQDA